MRGTILGVHDGRGFLLTSDDRRLDFPLSEWRSAGTPYAGQVIDFVDDAGQVHAVFAVPGVTAAAPPHSDALVFACVAIGCLVLGFVIPLIPTIAAFVLGVIGAGKARTENHDTALVLSRIAWIGALVLLVIGVVAMLAVLSLISTLGLAAIWHGVGTQLF